MNPAKPASRLSGWRARLIVILLALSPFVLLEAVLWGIGFHSDARFRSFVPEATVFETVNGVVRLKPERTHGQFHTVPFQAKKPANTVRIFCLGDSVTLGWYNPGGTDGEHLIQDPYPALLEKFLKQRFPGINFEVINCGASGHASYRIARLVKEVLNYSPDIVTVMFGANEFHEARYYADWKQAKTLYSSWLMDWKTLTLARDLLRLARQTGPQAPTPLRTEIFDTHLPVNDADALRGPAERKAILDHAESNLRAILDACNARGVNLVLMTEAANLAENPSPARLPAQTSENANDKIYTDAMNQANALTSQGKYLETLPILAQAIEKLPKDHPGCPWLYFAQGQVLRKLFRQKEARESYLNARNLDLLPSRATGDLNARVLRFAQKYRLALADAEKAIEDSVADGIPDDRIFYDSCHPSQLGHKLIADALFQSITNVVAERLQSP